MVDAQQLRYFGHNDDDRSLRLAFIEDLMKEIQKRQEIKYQILAMLDTNEDVKNGDVKEALSHLSLWEAILAKYENDSLLMYDKEGVPCECIFVTPTLHISKGYLPYRLHITTNHQGSWIEINHSEFYVHVTPLIATEKLRKLKFKDSKILRSQIP